jgi:trimeric autotransporter adhesin
LAHSLRPHHQRRHALDYESPITELHGRLVNLDLTPDFSAAAPVLGSDPVGSLTGAHYPSSLVRPDKLGYEPRIGISWRPIPASTVVVRAGYGVYHDTSVYLASAQQLAQQAPLSTSLNVKTPPPARSPSPTVSTPVLVHQF